MGRACSMHMRGEMNGRHRLVDLEYTWKIIFKCAIKNLDVCGLDSLGQDEV
jgi:hypothetical protein